MFKLVCLKSMVFIAMNAEIPAVIDVHHIYKNVQVSKHQMDINGKKDVILIVIVLMFYFFLSCNSSYASITYTGKTVNFRHKMNNHITACP